MLYTLACAAWRFLCLPTLIYVGTTIFADFIQERSSESSCILYLFEFIRDMGFNIYAKLLNLAKTLYTNISMANDNLIILEPILINSIMLIGAGFIYTLVLLLINSTQGIKSLIMTVILLPPLSCILHGYLQPMIQQELYEDLPWFKNNLSILKFVKDKQNVIGSVVIFAIIMLFSLKINDINSLLDIIFKDLIVSGIIFIGINFIALLIYIVIFFISMDGEIWSLGYKNMCEERLQKLANTNNVVVQEYQEEQTQQPAPQQPVRTRNESLQQNTKEENSEQNQGQQVQYQEQGSTQESQDERSVFSQASQDIQEQSQQSVFLNNPDN